MANEKRLIDANDICFGIETFKKCYRENVSLRPILGASLEALMMVEEFVNRTPTVDAVEVVHGRLGTSYIDEYYGEFANCLECGTDNILPCSYCRNCGAKMDGDGNG